MKSSIMFYNEISKVCAESVGHTLHLHCHVLEALLTKHVFYVYSEIVLFCEEADSYLRFAGL
jgi:hypothetical protein